MKKIFALTLALASAASLSACYTPQQQTGTLAGGALGAGTGALIGSAVTHGSAGGAIAGGLIGAGTGALIGNAATAPPPVPRPDTAGRLRAAPSGATITTATGCAPPSIDRPGLRTVRRLERGAGRTPIGAGQRQCGRRFSFRPLTAAEERSAYLAMGGGDFGGGWSGSSSSRRLKEQRQFGLGLGGAGQLEFAAVSSAKVNVDHLNGGEFLEHAARGQARRERFQAATEGENSLGRRYSPFPSETSPRAQATSIACAIPRRPKSPA